MPLVPKPQSRIQVSDAQGLPSNYFTRFLTNLTDAINGTSGVVAVGVNQQALGIGSNVSSGAGTPEGVVAGSPGDLYVNTAGGAGATLWVKETGVSTKVGWIAK
jgi:hypothetical protein